jgi:hypothetical protein
MEDYMEDGKKRALVIGINQYEQEKGFNPLKYAVADAEEVAKLLDDKKIAEFEEVVLLNEKENQTSSQVQSKLADIINKTEKDDLVVIYFAGHGKLDKRDRLCLVTLDTEIDKLRATSVPLDNINRMIEEIQCRGVVCILDSCYSVTQEEATRGGAGDIFAESFRSYLGPEQTPEAIILSAAEGLARERKELGHGIFTKFLIEGLKKEADENKDGYVSIEELFNYVNRKVRAETQETQQPTRWPREWGETGKVIIAKNTDTIAKKYEEIAKEELDHKLDKLFEIHCISDESFDAKIHARAAFILKKTKSDLSHWEKKYLDHIEFLLVRYEEDPKNVITTKEIISNFIKAWTRINDFELSETKKQEADRGNRMIQEEARQPCGIDQEMIPKSTQGSESAMEIPQSARLDFPEIQPSRPDPEPQRKATGDFHPQKAASELAIVCYCDKDKDWLVQLKEYLKPFKDDLWDDTQIEPGQDWRKEIIKALNSAKVAIFLVSQNFIESQFIQKHEFSPLFEKAQTGGVTILWIAVSHCTYETSEFEKYKPLNNPEKPLNSLKSSERQKELCQICEKISDRIKSLKTNYADRTDTHNNT